MSITKYIKPSLYTLSKRVCLMTKSLSCSKMASFLICTKLITSANTVLVAELHSVLEKAKSWSVHKKIQAVAYILE